MSELTGCPKKCINRTKSWPKLSAVGHFTMDMTWRRLILLSLSKKRPKKHFRGPSGANHWWLSLCSASWLQQHSISTFFCDTLCTKVLLGNLRVRKSSGHLKNVKIDNMMISIPRLRNILKITRKNSPVPDVCHIDSRDHPQSETPICLASQESDIPYPRNIIAQAWWCTILHNHVIPVRIGITVLRNMNTLRLWSCLL